MRERCSSTPPCTSGSPRCSSPFASAWRPAAVAAGVVAGWLTLVLALSFRLRKRIGQKGWRRLHYASFAAFVLALGHALTAGTDLKGIGGPVLVAIAAGPVIWLAFTASSPRRPARGPAKPATAVRPSPDSARAAAS